MMGEGWEFIRSDFQTGLMELSVKDFHDPFLVILSLILLFLPLSGIDRRDRLTAMTYVLYITSVAILLILAIPQNLPDLSDLPWHMLLALAIILIALYRWYHRHNRVTLRSHEGNHKEFERLNHEEN